MTNNISKRFTIMVSKGPFEYRNAENALKFCYAAIEQGYVIEQVFFYQSGVQNASVLLRPNTGEVQVYENWCTLHERLGISLNVCVTAASRRGVLSTELVTHEQSANLCHPFTQVGLSAYFESLSGDSLSIQL
jgi:tRNA 2-thiouridine synthesizing protein D